MVKLAEATDNPDDQGAYWELISRESNGASEFCIGIGRFDPGEVHPPHNHPHAAEFYLMTAGRARLIIGDEVREIGPGTAVYIPRGTRHWRQGSPASLPTRSSKRVKKWIDSGPTPETPRRSRT